MFSRKTCTVTILLLIIASIGYALPKQVNSGLGGDVFKGYLDIKRVWSIDQKPVEYALYSIGDEWILVYSTSTETRVYSENYSLKLLTIGSPRYYLIGDKLFITSIGGQGFDIYVVDPLTGEVLISYSETLSSYVFEDLSGIYYDGSRLINVYYCVRDYGSNTWLLNVEVDLEASTASVRETRSIDTCIFTGNTVLSSLGIGYGSTTYNETIYVRQYSGLLEIQVGDNTYSLAGRLYGSNPVFAVNDTLYFVVESNGYTYLVGYVDGEFKTSSYTYRSADLEEVIPVENYVVVARRNSSAITVEYIDAESMNRIGSITVSGEELYSMIHDMDGDGLPEPIVYSSVYYEAVYTGNETTHRIYWDKLWKPIHSTFNRALVNNTMYYTILFYTGDQYVLELLFLNEAANPDYTPPTIVVDNPLNNKVYVREVSINISSFDNESNIYCLVFNLSRKTKIIYSKTVYSDSFDTSLELEPGTYTLNITVWNTYGLSSKTSIVFHVVEYDASIIEPANYSVVKPLFNLVVLSNDTYTGAVYVNNTYIDTYILDPGMNTVLVNTSSFNDGLLILDFKVLNTSRTYRLFIYRDGSQPIINIHGLVNESTVCGEISFTIKVYDEFLDKLALLLDDLLLKNYSEPGSYSVLIDTRRYPNGVHRLAVEAVDLAGNKASENYILVFNNTYNPSIAITPEPLNNTFVSGVLEYRVQCVDVESLRVIVNDTLLYVFNSTNGSLNVSVVFNTTAWIDDVYVVVFNGTGYGGGWIVKKYVWFVDNNPPKLYMNLPVIGWGGRWENNSVVPRFHPVFHNTRYIIEHGGREYFKIYVNVSDRWLCNATLYINGSTPSMLIDGEIRPAVFNESRGYMVYVEVPGEGYYVLELVGFDQSNHSSDYILGVWFDLTSPKLEILYPLNNSLLNTNILNLTYRVIDNISKTVSIGFNIQYNEFHKPGLDEYAPMFPYPIVVVNNSYSSFFELRDGDGKYYVSLIAIDHGMNYYVETIVLTIDTTPPFVNLTYNVTGYTISLLINITDNLSGFSNGSIYLNGELLETINDTLFYGEYLVEPGEYNLTVTAMDRVGNVFNKTYHIVVGTSESTSPITEPTETESPAQPTHSSKYSSSPKTTPSSGEKGYPWITIAIVVAIALFITAVVLKKKR